MLAKRVLREWFGEEIRTIVCRSDLHETNISALYVVADKVLA